MSPVPSNNPVVQQLQLLLTGYGYNFYNATNKARADDLLVRERASYHLAQASHTLTTLRGAYQQRFIPPLTRANPDPPREALARVDELEEVQQELGNIEAHIRGMSVPMQDRIWWRLRNEQTLLEQLFQSDLALVQASELVYLYVAQLTPDIWHASGNSQIKYHIQQAVQLARNRERFLLLQL